MDHPTPRKMTLNQTMKTLITNLSAHLETVTDTKTELLKNQLFEKCAQFRDIEKHLRKAIEKLETCVK